MPSMNSHLMPHAVCWATDPTLIWTMVVSNLITFLSYLTLCCTLIYLVARTRKAILRDWAYFVVGFALFIVACGTTHLLEVITTWNPIFWVDAWTNIITCILSACVAAMLIRRARLIAFGVNDYATRLANTESEKSKMEDSLLAAQKLEEWSRMSASVNHEIKNPLQAIQNLQFLIGCSEGVTPEIAELSRMAGEEARRVLEIANASLSYFRQGVQAETVDLTTAIDSVRVLLQPLLRQKGIELLIEQTGPCTVEAFPAEPRQVLLNLVRNACEATDPNTSVRVELTGKPSGVSVTISDSGPGIDPDILPNLFNFGVSTKGSMGNGMGLWTVKHILDKHRGEIKITSQQGQGTRVQLWWPATGIPAPGAALNYAVPATPVMKV
jgi:signal transduction histidine kinase